MKKTPRPILQMRATLHIIRPLRRMFPIFLMAGIAVATSGCYGNARFSAEDMNAGLRTIDWIDANHGIDRNEPVARPLKELQFRLIAASTAMYRGVGFKDESLYNPESIPWDIYVIQDPNPNAFSAAPGFVFVTYGIINSAHYEAELASIIAHEMAHILLGHTQQALHRMRSKHQSAEPFVGYTESQEIAADRLGTKILESAGYDTDSALSALTASHQGHSYTGVADREARLYQLQQSQPCNHFPAIESREFIRMRDYVSSRLH